MSEILKNKLQRLPHSPGVYLFKDKNKKIIYIGKARDLFKRVSQYFSRLQEGKVASMVKRVEDLDLILTKTEKEALILEMNLIQTHYPRYNIMLRDDSHYPYIALSLSKEPVVKITRNTKTKNYRYFGPFPRSTYAYDVVQLLNKIYPTKKCKRLPKTPCLYYHLDQCLGYCFKNINEEQNEEVRKKIINFLEGDVKEVRDKFTAKMQEASEKWQFEQANEYKEIIASIDHVIAQQFSEISDKIDKDVFSYSSRDGYLALNVLIYRGGRLLGRDDFVVFDFGEQSELISQLIRQYYQNKLVPKQILIANDEVKDALSLVLKAKIINPKRGLKKELINLGQKNVVEHLNTYLTSTPSDAKKTTILEELGSLVDAAYPKHIDLFDNAHISGASGLGVLVSFINGVGTKKLYRKYNIDEEIAKDDYTSLREVMSRHYKRKLSEEASLPDLVIVDGGIGQLRVAKKVKEEMNLPFRVVSLVKNERHQTESLLTGDEEVVELDKKSPLFFFLMKMQDEVHRYAITSHRRRRKKSFFTSSLNNIKGLGPKRKEAILSAYPTIELLKKASLEELSQIVPSEVAKAIIEHFKEEK